MTPEQRAKALIDEMPYLHKTKGGVAGFEKKLVAAFKEVMPDMDKLEELKLAATIACKEAFCSRNEIDDAVNWGDIQCSSAEFSVDDEGDTSYRVILEEASPDCTRFREFISAKLEAAGFHNVEVLTEW